MTPHDLAGLEGSKCQTLGSHMSAGLSPPRADRHPSYPAQAPPPCPWQQFLATYIHVAGIDVAIPCVRGLQHHTAVVV